MLAVPTARLTGLRTRARSTVPDGLLTMRQAAAALGVGERTLRDHLRSGDIRYIDVGRGRQRRALRFAPEDLEDFKRSRRGQPWPSTRDARSTTTSSSTEVVDFVGLRAARASGKPKTLSARSGKRRRRKPNVVKFSGERR